MTVEKGPDWFEKNPNWASCLREHIEEVRIGATDLHKDVDVERYIRGHVLYSIQSDDKNTLIFKQERFTPKNGETSRQQILERLRFESELEELPEDIRDQLKPVIAIFEQTDCSDYRSYSQARDAWLEMSSWVETIIESDPQLNEDHKYSFREELAAGLT